MDISAQVNTGIWVGTLVQVRASSRRAGHPEDSRIYRIAKQNPKNWIGEDEQGRRLQGSWQLWEKAPEGTTFSAAPKPESDNFVLGSVARSKNGIKGYAKDQLFVVVAVRGERINIAKLGGDANRYWRCNPAGLELVPQI